MTAEVAIINSSAVAIAADSAVTIGRGNKIYNSALKVFSLSKIAPVGVMIYGNATLMSLPWETIIKIYREQLGCAKYDVLELYSDDFFRFLNNKKLFSESDQLSWMKSNIYGYFSFLVSEICNKVNSQFSVAGSLDEDATKDIVQSVISERVKSLAERPYCPDMDEIIEEKVRNCLKDIIAVELVEPVFQNLPVDDDLLCKLLDIAAYVVSREVFSENKTGIVVCGFGEEDIFPTVCTYEIDGLFLGRLKYRPVPTKTTKIENGNECSIIPFAQDDMVRTFVEGFNPEIGSFIFEYLTSLFDMVPDLIDHQNIRKHVSKKETVKEILRSNMQALLSNFFEQLNNFKRGSHIDPVLNMVQVLPKDELAAMAEALVNLTAFKRRMTDALETVGGPIDVAVISKGDGLVWVKRKQYFPPELNHHFFTNYFRGVINEKKNI